MRATHKIYGWFFTLKEKSFPISAVNRDTDKARVEKDHRDKKKRLRREDFGWLPSSTAFIVKAARALSAGGCPGLYCVSHSHQPRLLVLLRRVKTACILFFGGQKRRPSILASGGAGPEQFVDSSSSTASRWGPRYFPWSCSQSSLASSVYCSRFLSPRIHTEGEFL